MSRWDQKTYDSLKPYRARPLAELEKRIGDITRDIETLIAAGKRPRILEVGHGYGSVLVELLKRFGPNIELHAISKDEYWGSWDVIKRNALLMKLVEESELATLARPLIHVADIDTGLPFSSGYFDLIYSQVSFHMFKEKLLFLQECCRVLAPGGTGLIDVHPLVHPDIVPELAILLDIRAGQTAVDFWTFIKNFKWLSQKQALLRDYLEIKKCDNPQLNASLRVAFDLSELRADWYGTKSIYYVDPQDG